MLPAEALLPKVVFGAPPRPDYTRKRSIMSLLAMETCGGGKIVMFMIHFFMTLLERPQSLLMLRNKKNRLKGLKLPIAAGTLALLAVIGAFYSQPKASIYTAYLLGHSEGTLLEDFVPKRPLPIPDHPAPKWTLPIPDHPAVDTWIRRFSQNENNSFQIQLDRAHFYVVPAQKIFVRKGLPKDLIYVALIESGFSPAARSRANAVGMWQIVSKTGLRFGLEQNKRVDERHDPMKAAQAVADYLSLLYDQFGSWSLALASYNAGENAVQGALDKSGLKTFWDLMENGYLPAETRDYVPKVFAAVKIINKPHLYGFRLDSEHFVAMQSSTPTSYKVKSGDSWSTLAARHKCSVTALAALNGMKPFEILKAGQTLKLPAGTPLPSITKVQTKCGKQSTSTSSSPKRNLSNVLQKSVHYPVRQKDTLS
jgi:hypothetical protein